MARDAVASRAAGKASGTVAGYRIFVGAFPTGELAGRIQALRLQHDPVTARITPPHVTLAGTYWRAGPATEENERPTIERLSYLAGKVQAFALLTRGVRTFAGSTVLYLAVEATPSLLAARRALLAALGNDKHAEHFVPHLTLAMRLPPDRTARLLAELVRSEWGQSQLEVQIDALQMMQRGAEDASWRCIFLLPLQGADA